MKPIQHGTAELPRGTVRHDEPGRPNETPRTASTPCNLSGPTDESIELAIEDPLLNLKHPTPELDPSVPLPTHVQLLHWIVLAQGSRWPRRQLITTYGLFAAYILYLNLLEYNLLDHDSRSDFRYDLMVILINSLFVVETVANAFLCYKLGKHNQVQRLITWANSQQSQDTTSPIMSSLRKVAWGGWAAYLFLRVGFNIYLPAKDYTVAMHSRMVGTVLFPLGYGLMFCLCFLWLWMNWVLHTAAQHWVQYRLDADGVLGVGGRDAGKELWEVLAQMKEVSSMWANNHAVRLITTTSIATGFLTLAEYMHCMVTVVEVMSVTRESLHTSSQ
jgi:hypothetical protein